MMTTTKCLLDAQWVSRERFQRAWDKECDCFSNSVQVADFGGNFYRTAVERVGRQFANALVVSTLEGHTLFRDAFRMLGVKKTETFKRIGREAGVQFD